MNTNKAIGILQAVKAGTADAFIRKAAIKDALDMAISALEKQEQDRWISVTERLPELDTDVLITDQYGDVWQATYIDWCGDERFVTAEESITIEVVVAWRPLPEAYKAEEES